MKPLVLLDCDNVIADFTGAVLDLVHEYSDRRYTHAHVVSYDILSVLPEPTDVKRTVWRRLRHPGVCERIRPHLDAFEGVKRLRDVADVHVVTTPLEGSDHWMAERAAWLKRHFDFSHKDVTFTDRKDLVMGDYIVDDKPEHTQRFGGLLWDTPYNRNVLHGGRVKTWNEVVDKVKRWAT